MHIGCIFVVLALVCVDMMEGSVRYVVGELGVNMNPDGSVTVGHVAKDNVFIDPTDDPYHVTCEVRKLSLFDKDDTLIKEYNFTTNSGSFEAEIDPVHDHEGVGVDGRRMSPTGALSQGFGEEILQFSEYIFVEEGSTSLGDQDVDVKLYDTKVEFVLGTLVDSDMCSECSSKVSRLELDIRFTSSGASRMAVKDGLTKVEKDGGVQILLPNAVTVDGNAQSSDGNPAIESEGDHVDVSIQFPTFNITATYEALIIPSDPNNMPEEEDENKGEENSEEEIQTEAEYSFSTKSSNPDEVLIGQEDDDEENSIEEGNQETAHASGPDDSNEDDPNSAAYSITGVLSLIVAVLFSILAGH